MSFRTHPIQMSYNDIRVLSNSADFFLSSYSKLKIKRNNTWPNLVDFPTKRNIPNKNNIKITMNDLYLFILSNNQNDLISLENLFIIKFIKKNLSNYGFAINNFSEKTLFYISNYFIIKLYIQAIDSLKNILKYLDNGIETKTIIKKYKKDKFENKSKQIQILDIEQNQSTFVDISYLNNFKILGIIIWSINTNSKEFIEYNKIDDDYVLSEKDEFIFIDEATEKQYICKNYITLMSNVDIIKTKDYMFNYVQINLPNFFMDSKGLILKSLNSVEFNLNMISDILSNWIDIFEYIVDEKKMININQAYSSKLIQSLDNVLSSIEFSDYSPNCLYNLIHYTSKDFDIIKNYIDQNKHCFKNIRYLRFCIISEFDTSFYLIKYIENLLNSNIQTGDSFDRPNKSNKMLDYNLDEVMIDNYINYKNSTNISKPKISDINYSQNFCQLSFQDKNNFCHDFNNSAFDTTSYYTDSSTNSPMLSCLSE